MSTLTSIIFGILMFSILIFVHELGHFIAAKASGVKVNEFSMFMGPAIFKKQGKETLYTIRCIPIGGYCAMEGEDEDTDSPRSFQKAKWWKRLIILVSGAAMNFLLGLILFVIIALPIQRMNTNTVAKLSDCYDTSSQAAFQLGDEVVKVGDEQVYVASDVSMLIGFQKGESVDFVVRRNGELVELNGMKAHTHEKDDGSTYSHFGFSLGVKDANFADKMGYAWNMTVDNIRNVRLSLAMLFTGKASFRDMMGPVGIVDTMTDVATQSPTWVDALMNILYFGAFIAVNLGVMNLLPIPALDGGRVVGLLLTTGIQKVTKKKLDPKYEGYVHGVGMILLLVLMAVIMFKDVFMIFKG